MSSADLKQWFRGGDPWVWLNAGAVALCVVMVVGLLGMIAVRGLGHFWPGPVHQLIIDSDGEQRQLLGQLRERESVSLQRVRESGVSARMTASPGAAVVQRHLYKVGNRDLAGRDFVWVLEPLIKQRSTPPQAVVIERRQWGDFIGFARGLRIDGERVPVDRLWGALDRQLDRGESLRQEIQSLEEDEIGAINHRLEALRLELRRAELAGQEDAARQAAIELEQRQLNARYRELEARLSELRRRAMSASLLLETVDGRHLELPVFDVVRAYRPNQMSLWRKLGHYLGGIWAFVSEEPREANTEGGIYPAIFGTVIMVILMSIIVTPFGVLAAVYLNEYAGQGMLTRAIRIAVSNLAGVPSIVYGVFGLGFFVYAVGGTIDQLFYPESLPAPTFGTGGLLWASLTLALLTLPVVIVSAEEGLNRIPRAIREGSYALGATRAETLWRVVLPMSSPAIMTGVILAVARAAGEVAPLMLVGVVKLAPSLPVDSYYPYFHLDRKFMHLGFHIYDVGFQSPNVEASRPLVFSTALLLILVILVLNITAVRVRNRLRERFSVMDG